MPPVDGPVTDPYETDPSLEAPAPSGSGLTPADVGLGDNPTNIAEWSTPQVPVAPTNPLTAPAPPDAGLGGKVGVSSKGMTAHGLQMSRGLFGRADANAADFAAQDQKRADAERSQYNQDVGAEGAANSKVGAINAQYEAEHAKILGDEAAFNKQNAEIEARFTAEAHAQREKYLQTYQEQLAGVRALAAQPGNPLAKVTPGQAMGLVGAQFIQGMLAVRGIHIDVTGQIERWVERGIQEHQQQIQNARDIAGDTMHLYEIARQSSQDDFEARQRYRGFVIQGMQTQIQASAAQFNSQLATANANVQNAKLQVDADAVNRQLGELAFNRWHTVLQGERQAAFQQGTLAIEQRKLDVEAKKAEALKNAKPLDQPQYITDTSAVQFDKTTGKQITGGKIIGVVNPKAAGAENAVKLITERSDFKGLVDQGVQRLRDLMPEGATTWDETRKLVSPEYRRFDKARGALLSQMLQAVSGKVVTEDEYKRWSRLLEDDKSYQEGSNNSEYLDLQKSANDSFNSSVQAARTAGILTSVGAEGYDPRSHADAQGNIPYSEPTDPALRATSKADLTGEAPVKGVAGQEVGRAVAKDSEQISTKNISGTWADFQRDQLAKDPQADIKLGQPEYAVAIDHIAAAAIHPEKLDEYAKSIGATKSETPDERRKLAREAISRMAVFDSGGAGRVLPEVQQYAAYWNALLPHDLDLLADESRTANIVKRLTWRPKQNE